MTSWKDRVRVEHSDLEARIGRLMDFMTTRDFDDLSDTERNLLHRQWKAMDEYMTILAERIAAFS